MTIKKFIFRTTIVLLSIAVILVIGFFIFSSLKSEVTTRVDSYEYALPFQKGTGHKIVQGYGGLFSHNHIAALDFEMPVGTSICAARDGVVYSYKDDSNEGGPFSKYKNRANYIIIKHDDGSFGCYWHLQKNGVLVKKGRVAKGQKIGLSGATGLVLMPHLHFSVKRILNYDKDSFIKTKFITTRGIIFLENGEYYKNPVN